MTFRLGEGRGGLHIVECEPPKNWQAWNYEDADADEYDEEGFEEDIVGHVERGP